MTIGPTLPKTPQKTHRLVVVKLHKTTKVFYTAAWWMVLARNTNVVETTAYGDDLVSRGVSHVLPWTVMEAVTPPSAARLHAIADVLANQMHERFMDKLYNDSKASAQAYASAMTANGVSAQRQVAAMNAEVDRHNADTERAATQAAVILSDTIFVSECALAVGGCVLSMGLAPAFLAGGGQAAFLLSSGYALAGQVVKSGQGEDVSTAIDPDFDTDQGASVGTFKADELADNATKAREAAILKQTKTYKVANARSLSLSRQLGQKMSSAARQRVVKNIAAARADASAAHGEIEALERSKTLLKTTSLRALPIIQAGVDLFFAYKAQHERLESLHVDWLGRDVRGE